MHFGKTFNFLWATTVFIPKNVVPCALGRGCLTTEQWQLLIMRSLWLWPNSWDEWLQRPRQCRLGREVPRQCCQWCSTSVQGSTKLSFSKHLLYCSTGVDHTKCIKSMTPGILQGWAACVIWGGHRVPYYSCSLFTVTCYEGFTLRHAVGKICRRIQYCCFFIAVDMWGASDSQCPRSVPCHDSLFFP